MAKLRILAENYSDTGNITATPPLAKNTNVNNLKSPSRAKVIRTNAPVNTSIPSPLLDTITNIALFDTTTLQLLEDTGIASSVVGLQELHVKLIPARNISAIVLGRHNFPENMQIRFEYFTDLDGTVPHPTIPDSGSILVTSYESGNYPVDWDAFIWDSNPSDPSIMNNALKRANFVYWLPETVTAVKSVTIYLYIPDGKAEIGRLMIGSYIEPAYTINFGHKVSWEETGKQYRTEGSTLRSDISFPNKKLEFSLDHINANDRIQLFDTFRYLGKRKDFYLSLFPDNADGDIEQVYSGIVKITKEPTITEYAHNFYNSKYVVEEV